MASLSFHGIVKQYPGNPKPTLKGIDLEVQDGEFLVLVGPSGCGKSTLLRIIAGLETITRGELKIGDRIVNDLAPKDRDIAMVFQSYALYPHMTVWRNMAFGLEVRKQPRSEIERLVSEAAKMLDLEPYLDKLPKQLSGGQRQRVAMGRAIVRRPSVFLFDEPLSNLDAALRTQMRVEIKRLHQRLKTTMVYVTHDQVEAMTLADRIAVLNDGRLQQVGSPLELFDHPSNRFVAGFIGSPSMNFLDARVIENQGQSWVFRVWDQGEIQLPHRSTLNPIELEQALVLGIRPQNLSLKQEGDTEGVTLKAKVDVIETLGWEAHLHLIFEGHPLLAVVESIQAQGLQPQDEVELFAPVQAWHLFELGEEGQALWEKEEA